MLKFADDTNLLVPEFTDVDMKEEFDAILAWATANKMVLNMNKTEELVFHRPSPNKYLSPVPLCDIELVREARITYLVCVFLILFQWNVMLTKY